VLTDGEEINYIFISREIFLVSSLLTYFFQEVLVSIHISHLTFLHLVHQYIFDRTAFNGWVEKDYQDSHESISTEEYSAVAKEAFTRLIKENENELVGCKATESQKEADSIDDFETVIVPLDLKDAKREHNEWEAC